MATAELANCRVLITRPEGRANELLAAVSDLGGSSLHLPMMRIEPLADDESVKKQAVSRCFDLDLYQRLIFISVNAVHHGLELIEDCWPQWPLKLQCYAIGKATADALRAEHIEVAETAESMTSEGLLDLASFAAPLNEKILIVRGVGGREHLAEALRARGAAVDYLDCYRRSPPAISGQELAAQLAEHCCNTLCMNSAETLENFMALSPPEAVLSWPVVVPSARVADTARHLGFSSIHCAANAGTAATIAALKNIAETYVV